MTRIVWTKLEKQAVIEKMVAAFVKEPYLTNKQALREGQTVLPVSRRMVITDQRAFSHKAKIELARTIGRQCQAHTGPSERVEEPVAISAPTPEPERKKDPTERLLEIFELLLDVVAARVAARVADHMNPPKKEDVHAAVNRAFDREYAKLDPLPLDEAKLTGKPGVLIIGLIPTQVNVVRSTRNWPLDLTFMTAEDAVTRPYLQRAHTILMTRFINHSVQEKYRKAPMLHFCNGATSALCEILDKLSQP